MKETENGKNLEKGEESIWKTTISGTKMTNGLLPSHDDRTPITTVSENGRLPFLKTTQTLNRQN